MFVWLPPACYTCMYNIIIDWCCYAYYGLACCQGENWEALSMIDTALLSKKEGYGLQRWAMVLVLALLFYVCYICHYITKANDSEWMFPWSTTYYPTFSFYLKAMEEDSTQWIQALEEKAHWCHFKAGQNQILAEINLYLEPFNKQKSVQTIWLFPSLVLPRNADLGWQPERIWNRQDITLNSQNWKLYKSSTIPSSNFALVWLLHAESFMKNS